MDLTGYAYKPMIYEYLAKSIKIWYIQTKPISQHLNSPCIQSYEIALNPHKISARTLVTHFII